MAHWSSIREAVAFSLAATLRTLSAQASSLPASCPPQLTSLPEGGLPPGSSPRGSQQSLCDSLGEVRRAKRVVLACMCALRSSLLLPAPGAGQQPQGGGMPGASVAAANAVLDTAACDMLLAPC